MSIEIIERPNDPTLRAWNPPPEPPTLEFLD